MKSWSETSSSDISTEFYEKCREFFVEVLTIEEVRHNAEPLLRASTLEMRVGLGALVGAQVAKEGCPEHAFQPLMHYLCRSEDSEIEALQDAIREALKEQEG